MDFSVVVPVHNARKYIDAHVEALLNQDYPADRYEIILVDNNSIDGSAEAAGRHRRLKLLREPEQSSYAARNRGVAAATGSILAFTDPDCVPKPDWLSRFGQAMSDPQITLALGDRLFSNDEGTLGLLAAYESACVRFSFEQRRVSSWYAYTNNMAVRTAAMRALGDFDRVQRGGDTLFLKRVLRHYGAAAIRYVPQAVVRHLEIASVGDYLQKKELYGVVNKDQLRGAEALPLGTRLRLAAHAVRLRPSASGAFGFAFVLAAGAARFEWARLRAGSGQRTAM